MNRRERLHRALDAVMDAKEVKRVSGSRAAWMKIVRAYHGAAIEFKGPNAWLTKRDGSLKHVGQYDEDLEQGEVYL